MQTTSYIWKNGKFQKWAKCQTHVLTHSLHYSAGVFEGIRFYKTAKGPAVFRLKEHIKRLFYSADTLNMHIPYNETEIKNAIIETIKKNKIESGYIRPIVYFGYGKMGLHPKGAPIDVAIAVWGWGAYLGEHASKVKISPYMRLHPKTTVPDAKICGHYTNSILASIDAKNHGYDEALLLDYQGNIAEGPGENFFMIKDEKIYTPRTGSILPGITRDAIITLAKDLDFTVIEKSIKPSDLKGAEEAFFTGTAAEVSPIASVDKIKFPKKNPITTLLKEEFVKITTGKNKKYAKWLTLAS
ncbi:MAG: branched-chain amino acid transaminase [Candidatus Gracilibacteria bacterium]|jgi:branched-chain amino acid aminotransferase